MNAIFRQPSTGLLKRLENMGIESLITIETNPDKAVEDYLQGNLITKDAEPHEHGHKHAEK
ncbi:hypothetical protein [Bathymodiolus heckerae thiotrophic gill symbiont]|uniref:hypothetical protein n=1 Tax=Bathymodiolus heckerae thiotrophic gill symbiont TaxID=1052212 RepID=UPI0010FE7EDE|nr:hypothetical protein [Bathymodiolus heckerae thiotrophic gill symbiont]